MLNTKSKIFFIIKLQIFFSGYSFANKEDFLSKIPEIIAKKSFKKITSIMENINGDTFLIVQSGQFQKKNWIIKIEKETNFSTWFTEIQDPIGSITELMQGVSVPLKILNKANSEGKDISTALHEKYENYAINNCSNKIKQIKNENNIIILRKCEVKSILNLRKIQYVSIVSMYNTSSKNVQWEKYLSYPSKKLENINVHSDESTNNIYISQINKEVYKDYKYGHSIVVKLKNFDASNGQLNWGKSCRVKEHGFNYKTAYPNSTLVVFGNRYFIEEKKFLALKNSHFFMSNLNRNIFLRIPTITTNMLSSYYNLNDYIYIKFNNEGSMGEVSFIDHSRNFQNTSIYLNFYNNDLYLSNSNFKGLTQIVFKNNFYSRNNKFHKIKILCSSSEFGEISYEDKIYLKIPGDEFIEENVNTWEGSRYSYLNQFDSSYLYL